MSIVDRSAGLIRLRACAETAKPICLDSDTDEGVNYDITPASESSLSGGTSSLASSIGLPGPYIEAIPQADPNLVYADNYARIVFPPEAAGEYVVTATRVIKVPNGSQVIYECDNEDMLCYSEPYPDPNVEETYVYRSRSVTITHKGGPDQDPDPLDPRFPNNNCTTGRCNQTGGPFNPRNASGGIRADAGFLNGAYIEFPTTAGIYEDDVDRTFLKPRVVFRADSWPVDPNDPNDPNAAKQLLCPCKRYLTIKDAKHNVYSPPPSGNLLNEYGYDLPVSGEYCWKHFSECYPTEDNNGAALEVFFYEEEAPPSPGSPIQIDHGARVERYTDTGFDINVYHDGYTITDIIRAWRAALNISNHTITFTEYDGDPNTASAVIKYVYEATDIDERDWKMQIYDLSGGGGPELLREDVLDWEQDPNTSEWSRTQTVKYKMTGGSLSEVAKRVTYHVTRDDYWHTQIVDPDHDPLTTTRSITSSTKQLEWQDNPDGSWVWNAAFTNSSDPNNFDIVRLRGWMDQERPQTFPDYLATNAPYDATVTTYNPSYELVARTRFVLGKPIEHTTYQYNQPTADTNYSNDGDDTAITVKQATSGTWNGTTLTSVSWLTTDRITYRSGYEYISSKETYAPDRVKTERYATFNYYRTSRDPNAGTYDPNLSTEHRELLYAGRTYNDQLDQYDEAIREAQYEFDEWGRITSQKNTEPGGYPVFSYTSIEWGDCCGTRIVEDKLSGITTAYTSDILGRPQRIERSAVASLGNMPAQKAQVAVYEYSVSSGKLTTTAKHGYVDGSTDYFVSQTQTVTDYHGRTLAIRELDGSGTLLRETKHSYSGDGDPRKITVIRASNDDPNGVTTETTFKRDGHLWTVIEKDATDEVLDQTTYNYGISNNPFITSVIDGDPNDPNNRRTVTTVVDMLGRTSVEIRHAFPSGSIATSYDYYGDGVHGAGRVKKISYSGASIPTQLFEYDGMGNLKRSGIDVHVNNSLDPATADRVIDYDAYITSYFIVQLRREYGVDPNGDPSASPSYAHDTKRLTRWDGFAYNQDFGSGLPQGTGVVVSDVKTIDAFGSETQTIRIVDSNSPLSLTTVKYPYADQVQATYALNGLIQQSTSPSGVKMTYAYDNTLRQYESRRVDPNDPNRDTWTQMRYGNDPNCGTCSGTTDPSLVYETVTPNGSGGELVTSRTFYLDGRVKSMTSPASKTTYYAYTPEGQLYRTWGHVPQPVEYGYNYFGERTSLTTYRDDTVNWSGTTWPTGIDPNKSDTTTWNYDTATGLLTQKLYADGNGPSYDYWPDGKLKKRTWATGGVTKYTYNANTNELTGVDYGDNGSNEIAYEYDRLGRRTKVTTTDPNDPNTVIMTHSYTYLDKTGGSVRDDVVTKITGPFTAEYIQEYDDGLQIGFGDYASGSVTYHTQYDYDPNTGRMSKVTGAGLPAGGATYDYVGGTDLLEAVTYKTASIDLLKRSYAYDNSRDLITGVTNAWRAGTSPPTISAYGYAWDNLGRPMYKQRSGVAFASTYHETFGYNDRNELTESLYKDATFGSGTVDPNMSHIYAYDPIGNRTADKLGDPAVDPNFIEVTSYASNKLNQYESSLTVDPNGGSADTLRASDLTYDASGNLIDFARLGDMDCDGDADAFDIDRFIYALNHTQAQWEADPNYNACEYLRGDMNGDGDVTAFDIDPFITGLGQNAVLASLAYDEEHRLIRYTPGFHGANNKKVEFKYDYLGRRYEKTLYDWDPNASDWEMSPAAQTFYLYDGWRVVAELDGLDPNDAVIRRYSWGLDLSGSLESASGIGGLLAVNETTGDFAGDYAYTYDHLGNVGQLIDLYVTSTDWDPNRLAAKYEYDPYGNLSVVIDPNGYAAVNPFRFSTKAWDNETGFGYWGYRYYSPMLGRWLNRDPIGEDGGELIYGYNYNTPITYYDPLGDVAGGAIAIGGGIAVADGPLPIGDVIGGCIILGAIILNCIDTPGDDIKPRPIPVPRRPDSKPKKPKKPRKPKKPGCYCLCIKRNPQCPDKNDGPYPIGRMSEKTCRSYPYSAAGMAEGYHFCFCGK